MNQNPTPANPPHALVEDSAGEDFLKAEYSLLNGWAIHGEDVVHRLFNFYITLVTSVLGALFVAMQFISADAQLSLLFVSGACGFLLALGVVFFDALVSQYIQNGYYQMGMKRIRDYFRFHHKAVSWILELPSLKFKTGKTGLRTMDHHYSSVTIGFPAGNQLALIAGINGILIGAVIWSLVWGIAGVGYRPIGTILASFASGYFTILIHNKMADIMIDRNLARMSPNNAGQTTKPGSSPDSD
jgi:hypothetical protein